MGVSRRRKTAMTEGVLLRPEATTSCPRCGDPRFQGVRGDGVLIATCPTHGVFTAVAGIGRDDVAVGRMNPEERLWLIEQATAIFLADPSNDDFMTIQTSTLPCNYVQLRMKGGELWGEVCSRQWDCRYCGNRPLDRGQEDGIAHLGFVDGGPHRNYEVEELPQDATVLARTLERALVTAFDEPVDF